ncbi:MAG: hypothetical protein J6V13_02445 [Paludibacteraceae bacterium]|nr:hypothetical protein [Paludibacteraceae bacterium]MBO7233831.1 hypothetical protein [Paludibacteraceae bacterium]MBO7259382.1 hypothetical protein [Paludibacteraceae bacterium]
MSVLFPKTNKPREWDYRPIYYDPEQVERKERLQQLQKERNEKNEQITSGRGHGLRHGAFREAAQRNRSPRMNAARKTKMRFWVVLLILLLFIFYYVL